MQALVSNALSDSELVEERNPPRARRLFPCLARRWLGLSAGLAVLLAAAAPASAQDGQAQAHQIAVLGALDKITARLSELVVPVGERAEFFRLTIDVSSCQTRVVEARQDAGVFLVITEQPLEGEPERLFSGWMFAGSPSVSALDHPIYDVWLVRCEDTGDAEGGEG